jgi:lipoate-protein ligase B
MTKSLPPIFVHYLKHPVRYAPGLALQEHIHAWQLSRRHLDGSHPDVLLLLQHAPVYTAGRRQTDAELDSERDRLAELNKTTGEAPADFVHTQRGGQLTYHGPGQLVGYPLLDLGRTTPPTGIREYICGLQTGLKRYLSERHGIQTSTSEHTGVFLDERTKLGSIGVQVRHRLTTHGFAINITNEPLSWFNKIVACGLVDVRAGSVQSALNGKQLDVETEAHALVDTLGTVLGRKMEYTLPEELLEELRIPAALES